MKFWELVSAFRSERNILDAVFAEQPENEFSTHYANFDALVASQNRDVLDAALPDDLVSPVATRSTQTFSLSADGLLRSAQYASDGQIISAIDVVNRFGGSVIEEVLERGSSRVGG